MSAPATTAEVMVAAMARELEGQTLAVQGIATPLVAIALELGRRTVAPGITLGYAIGNSYGQEPGPLSLSDPEALTLTRSVGRFGFADAVAELLPHANPLEFFRPAQVDPTGATNNIAIGDPRRPKIRLPGSAGIPDVSPGSRTARLYVPRHDPRVFVETLDVRSGAGYVAGKHPGPVRVFTDLATLVLRDGRLGVERRMPGVDLARVQAATGFELAPGEDLGEVEPPPPEWLRLIREELDPRGLRDLDFLPRTERFLALYRIACEERAAGSGVA